MRKLIVDNNLCVSKAHIEEEEEEMGGLDGAQFFTPENGVVALFDEVTPASAAKFVDELMATFLSNPCSPILIWINSPGGSVYDGLLIVEAIKTLPVPTIGFVSGLAGSMGLYILQACTHRYIGSLSLLFWHEMIRMDFAPTVTAKEAEKKAADYQKLNKHLLDFLKGRIKITEEVWQKTFIGQNDVTFTAKESKKLNLVDGIVEGQATLIQLFNKLADKMEKEQNARNESTRSPKVSRAVGRKTSKPS